MRKIFEKNSEKFRIEKNRKNLGKVRKHLGKIRIFLGKISKKVRKNLGFKHHSIREDQAHHSIRRLVSHWFQGWNQKKCSQKYVQKKADAVEGPKTQKLTPSFQGVLENFRRFLIQKFF